MRVFLLFTCLCVGTFTVYAEEVPATDIPVAVEATPIEVVESENEPPVIETIETEEPLDNTIPDAIPPDEILSVPIPQEESPSLPEVPSTESIESSDSSLSEEIIENTPPLETVSVSEASTTEKITEVPIQIPLPENESRLLSADAYDSFALIEQPVFVLRATKPFLEVQDESDDEDVDDSFVEEVLTTMQDAVDVVEATFIDFSIMMYHWTG